MGQTQPTKVLMWSFRNEKWQQSNKSSCSTSLPTLQNTKYAMTALCHQRVMFSYWYLMNGVPPPLLPVYLFWGCVSVNTKNRATYATVSLDEKPSKNSLQFQQNMYANVSASCEVLCGGWRNCPSCQLFLSACSKYVRRCAAAKCRHSAVSV